MNFTHALIPLAMVLIFILGEAFDHTQWKYGWPPLLYLRKVEPQFYLRWNLIGALIAVLIGLVSGIGFPRH